MAKAAEEGKIWEWRAFGRISDRLAAAVEAYPIRMGIKNLRGEDIYLISPASDQNVKLRSSSSGKYLKFKLLLESKPGAIELYKESVLYTYPFPINFDVLKEAARLLNVALPADTHAARNFSEDESVRILAASSPHAARVDVKKVRSQYSFDGGWMEVGIVDFKQRRAQTFSLHSEDIEIIKSMIEKLQPGDEMEAMNYIEACRRWG